MRSLPCLVLALALSATTWGCSSDDPPAADPDAGGFDAAPTIDASTSDVATDGAPDVGAPPFHCDAAAATSPTLAGTFLFDPKDPHPGDTVTVLVRSTKFSEASAPKMTLDATSSKGTSTEDITITSGGKGVTYYYAIPDVPVGDVCLLTHINGAPELAGKITVTPRPAPAPSPNGVYKVKTNHQFTCQEEPIWGNELHVAVYDAQGKGVPGAVVTVRLPDTTDVPTIKNAGTKPVPKTLTMDGSGKYDDYFWWPSNDNGYTIFDLSVQGSASDVATEISSGWWETDATGCRYCNTGQPQNVYGHWSHRIEFKLDAATNQACLVPSDHAGMAACASTHGHAFHHPTHQACWTAR